MKKILFVLIASLVALTNVANAAQVKTKLAAPFQTLNIDTQVWTLDDSDKSSIGFTLIEDDEVDFDIFQGRPLKKVSTGELAQQIKKANGNLSKVSLLKNSFPHLEDPEDDDEVVINDWVPIEVNGIRGIKFHIDVTLTESEFTIDGGENIISETIYPGIGYFLVTGNRIYAMSFSAPSEKFSDLEPLFEKTLQNLFY